MLPCHGNISSGKTWAALLGVSDPSCLLRRLVLRMVLRAVACIIPEESKCLFQSRASNDFPVVATLSMFVNVQINRNLNYVGRCGSW